ncbi:MAG: hypothetical protein NVSMB9_14250 [Isosphaeraceae bacterium]
MHSHDPQAGTQAGPESFQPAAVEATRRVNLWPWALIAGLAAGLGGGLIGESTYHIVRPKIQLPDGFEKLGAYDKSAALADAQRMASIAAERRNTAMAYGALGGLLGGALGLAGGLARRSAGGGLIAAAVGVVGGTAVGAGASFVLTPIFFQLLDPTMGGMVASFVVHGGVFGSIGAMGGLTLGLGRGGRGTAAHAALGGLLGALVGAVLYESAETMFYPLVRVGEPIPGERLLRLALDLTVAVFTALGAVSLLRERRTERTAATP